LNEETTTMEKTFDVRVLGVLVGETAGLADWDKDDRVALSGVVRDWLASQPEAARNTIHPRGAATGERCWHEIRDVALGRRGTVSRTLAFYGVTNVAQELDQVVLAILQGAELLAALTALESLAPAFARPQAPRLAAQGPVGKLAAARA
jgi:hypothetical protein